MKMISKDNNNEEEKIINAKTFEKETREEGLKLPDKEPADKKPDKSDPVEKKATENKSEGKKPEKDEKSSQEKASKDKKPGKPAEKKTDVKKAEKTEAKSEAEKADGKKAEGKEAESKKAEGLKTEGKNTQEKTPEGKTPEEKKSEGTKTEDKKPEGKKAEDKENDGKKSEEKPEEKKSEKEGEKPEDKKSEEKKAEKDGEKPGETLSDKERSGLPAGVKILLIAAGIVLVAYLAVTVFFLSHFTFNIYVNGLDVSLMGLQEANKCLCAKKGNDYEFVITSSGNEVAVLTDKDLNSHYDYTNELKRLKSGESRFWWIPYLTYSRSYDIEPDLVFDEAAAKNKILELEPVKHTPNEHKSSVNIKKSDQNGYIMIKTEEKQPDQNKLVGIIISDMHKLSPVMELNDTDYDVDIPYTELQNEAVQLFSRIDAIQNTKILFTDHGQELQIDKDTLSGFLRTDGQGRFIVDKEGYPTLDKEKIDEYSVDVIGKEFTSKDTNMWWHKYNGGTVSVNSGTYGKTVDTEGVSSLIETHLDNTEDYEGPPDYLVDPDADPNAPDEIGDTYIEVDMTRQKLYYIKDGKLFMTSDVVTGNKGRHHDTTQLMAYIYFMQRDRVLVGEDYRTPVKYWMAFHNHEGLHDASWRKSFGGDIYKYNGSHGCVNLPTAFAAELYDNVYVGLPVITYY